MAEPFYSRIKYSHGRHRGMEKMKKIILTLFSFFLIIPLTVSAEESSQKSFFSERNYNISFVYKILEGSFQFDSPYQLGKKINLNGGVNGPGFNCKAIFGHKPGPRIGVGVSHIVCSGDTSEFLTPNNSLYLTAIFDVTTIQTFLKEDLLGKWVGVSFNLGVNYNIVAPRYTYARTDGLKGFTLTSVTTSLTPFIEGELFLIIPWGSINISSGWESFSVEEQMCNYLTLSVGMGINL